MTILGIFHFLTGSLFIKRYLIINKIVFPRAKQMANLKITKCITHNRDTFIIQLQMKSTVQGFSNIQIIPLSSFTDLGDRTQ